MRKVLINQFIAVNNEGYLMLLKLGKFKYLYS